MKVLPKAAIAKKGSFKYCILEKEILQSNPPDSYLLCLYYSFQTLESLFMVIDYCPFNDFSLLLLQKPEGRLSEAEAKVYIAEIFLGMDALHERGFLYRDMKPENVLIDAEGHARIGDFGLSASGVRSKSDFARSRVGTKLYFPPELLS